ncbi:hypothetical protein NIES2098_38660 [Calothrix sp. NIES-2098]|nr:hypothetical protein NIES2098_38660 [Calothrix sp. NIES-2098]
MRGRLCRLEEPVRCGSFLRCRNWRQTVRWGSPTCSSCRQTGVGFKPFWQRSQCVAEDTALGGSADLKQVSVGVPPVVATGVEKFFSTIFCPSGTLRELLRRTAVPHRREPPAEGCPKGCRRGLPHLLPSVLCLSLVIANSIDNLAFSQNPSSLSDKGVVNNQPGSACIEQNLETLTTYLLRDLPSYTNRVTQRARRLSRNSEVYSYMLLAGRPEFTPLPLNPGIDTTDTSKSVGAGVEQVFFTTLERQYIGAKAVELQEFHWLFLTKTQSSWRLVMMFTQTGSSPKQQPPTPPRDSSKSTVAQAINLWLRDCQAGSVRMPGKLF